MIFLKHVFDEIQKELCHLDNASTYAGFAAVWHCHLQRTTVDTMDEKTVREKLYDSIVGASNRERAKLEYDLKPTPKEPIPKVRPSKPRLLSMTSFDHVNLEMSRNT
jgi:hypothetical protein